MTVRERPAAVADRTSSIGRVEGYTLVEAMFVACLIAVIVATTVPQLTVGMESARTRAAARYLAAQMIFARTQAVGRSATVALRFQRDARGVTLTAVLDGNRNGVRTRDIDSGVDRQIQPPARLDQPVSGRDDRNASRFRGCVSAARWNRRSCRSHREGRRHPERFSCEGATAPGSRSASSG